MVADALGLVVERNIPFCPSARSQLTLWPMSKTGMVGQHCLHGCLRLWGRLQQGAHVIGG